jgi:Coenzyme PQQ synthesis protein D (PqqD)
MIKNTVLPGDSRLFFIDAEGLVFREASQRLYGLNTFSTFLWSCLETNPSIPDAIHAAVEQLGLDEKTAANYAHLALEQWRKLGLIGDQPEAPRPVNEVQKYTDVTGIAPLDMHTSNFRLNLCLLECPVSLYFDEPDPLPAVRAVIGHLEVADTTGLDNSVKSGTPGIDATIHVCRHRDHYTVYRNKQPVAHFDDASAIAPTVKSILLQEAIDHCDYLFYFHAGVLSNGDALVLLPGAQGAGKSTLTTGLMQAGLEYFSDEVALLNQGSKGIRPFPIALCSKKAAWGTLESLFEGFDKLPVHLRLDGKTVRYMPPPVNPHDPDYDRPLPVRHIVFPSYSPDATTELKPLGRVAALERLMEECLAIKRTLTQEAVAWLAEWIEGIDCYELPNSSLQEAVAAVKHLVTPETR